MQSILSVSSGQLELWTTTFLWPFVRMLALFSTAPIFGESWVPRQIKVGCAALFALVLGPTLQIPPVPIVSVGGLWIIAQQVIIGAAMGLTMRMVFAAVQAAGEYIGLQMGLSFASFYDPMSRGATMVVARLLNMIAMLIFLALDGHLLMIQALADSFRSLPIADAPLAANGWMVLALAGARIFEHGLVLSLPLVTALLILNMAMGILNRSAPQFSIFSVGFPLTLLFGIGMLQLLVPRMSAFLQPVIAEGIQLLMQFTAALHS